MTDLSAQHPAEISRDDSLITADAGTSEAVTIRPQAVGDIDKVVAFALPAWKPVHESMAQVLGPRINRIVYPDWAASQARDVESAFRDDDVRVWVAELDARTVGFVSVVLHAASASGEIDMIAVDPDCQGQGIGTALVRAAVAHIEASGLALVEIATGGDPGHAAARRLYEKAGFTPLPLVRYYKALPETVDG